MQTLRTIGIVVCLAIAVQRFGQGHADGLGPLALVAWWTFTSVRYERRRQATAERDRRRKVVEDQQYQQASARQRADEALYDALRGRHQ